MLEMALHAAAFIGIEFSQLAPAKIDGPMIDNFLGGTREFAGRLIRCGPEPGRYRSIGCMTDSRGLGGGPDNCVKEREPCS